MHITLTCRGVRRTVRWVGATFALTCVLPVAPASAEDVVNLYSARKEALIQPLLETFTEAYGIPVRVVTGKGGQLQQRMVSEGRNSPADVLLTVDAGNLWRATEAGLLRSVASPTLEKLIPARFRDPEGRWFGLSLRARAVVYAIERVHPGELGGYLALADPAWRGRLLVRSSSNIYNQSLIAALIGHYGIERAEDWARGIVSNMARAPSGGDRDQIRAVAAGEGDIAIVNSYYYAQMLFADEAGSLSGTAIHFPEDKEMGTHVNVSGAGVARHAPHPEAGLRLIEFLASPEAQALYAEVNREFPVTDTARVDGLLAEWNFVQDSSPVAGFGPLNGEAVRLADRAGWR